MLDARTDSVQIHKPWNWCVLCLFNRFPDGRHQPKPNTVGDEKQDPAASDGRVTGGGGRLPGSRWFPARYLWKSNRYWVSPSYKNSGTMYWCRHLWTTMFRRVASGMILELPPRLPPPLEGIPLCGRETHVRSQALCVLSRLSLLESLWRLIPALEFSIER